MAVFLPSAVAFALASNGVKDEGGGNGTLQEAMHHSTNYTCHARLTSLVLPQFNSYKTAEFVQKKKKDEY